MPDKAKKMCYLESSYKEYLSKVSSSFTWISHFDFNYKLEAIVTQKCTFSDVFSTRSIIRQMWTIIHIWIFFFSFSEEQISYALNPCLKTKQPVRHSIIGLTKRAWLWI